MIKLVFGGTDTAPAVVLISFLIFALDVVTTLSPALNQ
jgi:hypothetical protein